MTLPRNTHRGPLNSDHRGRGTKRRAADSSRQCAAGETKRRAGDNSNLDTADNSKQCEADSTKLATLANVSAQQCPEANRRQTCGGPSLRAYSLSAGQEAAGESAELTFDESRRPPADITEELLQYMDKDINLVSKIIQPQRFLGEYHEGRVDMFLLLGVLANNVVYSQHPALRRLGFVRAIAVFVDQAKTLAPLALEHPTLRNCQALLLLSMAYMHLDKLDVSSHYSSISLRMLQQLGACKLDNSTDDDAAGWLQASWLDREQTRRLVWGCFTVDTFLSLMQHTAPYVLVDLSGVNRPCAQNMWYVGNDSLDSLSFPGYGKAAAQDDDSEYLTTLKTLKHRGVPWRMNGASVQVNFAVLANALLRSMGDPQQPAAVVDRLVVHASRSVCEWLAPLPHLPPEPSVHEMQLTLIISAAVLGLKSIISPYLFSRSRRLDLDQLGGDKDTREAMRDLASPEGPDRLLADYIQAACQHFCFAQLAARMARDTWADFVPPMFAAHAMVISGGMFAACAHSLPTDALRRRFDNMAQGVKADCRMFAHRSFLFQRSLDEIEAIEHMARFLPRRLTQSQLADIRDTLLPTSIEAVVNRRFSAFIAPITPILRAATSPPLAPSSPAISEKPKDRCPGVIPLTSNLCAIFGQSLASLGYRLARSVSNNDEPRSPCSSSPPPAPSSQPPPKDPSPGPPPKVPDYPLTFTAVSSLMVGMSVATKEENFFNFLDDVRHCTPSNAAGASLEDLLN